MDEHLRSDLLALFAVVLIVILVGCAPPSMKNKSLSFLEWACYERDTPEACSELGVRKLRLPDHSEAHRLFEGACGVGIMESCCRLGEMYWGGQGTAVDLGRAEELQRQSCDGGYLSCCDNVGLMYESDLVPGKGASDAKPLFEVACESGHPRGCFNVGLQYHQGSGVEKNPTKAALFYQKACDGDFKRGCHHLGILYERGQGVEKDEYRALALFDRACSYHNKEACTSAQSMRRVGACRQACLHEDKLVEAHDLQQTLSETESLTETVKRVMKLHPYCVERCIGDVVNTECLFKATSLQEAGACHL